MTLFLYVGNQPLGLWRDVAKDSVISQGSNGPDIQVRQGERIFIDLQKAHHNVSLLSQQILLGTILKSSIARRLLKSTYNRRESRGPLSSRLRAAQMSCLLVH